MKTLADMGTGVSPMVALRMEQEDFNRIQELVKDSGGNRSELLRRWIKQGLRRQAYEKKRLRN